MVSIQDTCLGLSHDVPTCRCTYRYIHTHMKNSNLANYLDKDIVTYEARKSYVTSAVSVVK